MTNPETRKTRRATASDQQRIQVNGISASSELDARHSSDICTVSRMDAQGRNGGKEFDCSDTDDSLTQTLDTEDELCEEDDISETCSSFSLQGCINEFKARRTRRHSTQSRDIVGGDKEKNPCQNATTESDLIIANQNRTNKEHERKYKPCKNGFCYCFTSDSGDGVATSAPGQYMRQHRRNRKSSESCQVSCALPQRNMGQSRGRRRQSAPPSLKEPPKPTTRPSIKVKTSSSDQIRAISRLETAPKDAPLIHIIQELRSNCVVSEVRVNKHKLQAQRSRSLHSKPAPKKTHFTLDECESKPTKHSSLLPLTSTKVIKPSAPPLEKISERDSLTETFMYSGSLDTSAKSNSSREKRHKAGGLFLQKRLSQAPVLVKPRNLSEPPPKPPRRISHTSDDNKSSVSSLASTTPSVREAERLVDDFLRCKGVDVSEAGSDKQTHNKNQTQNKAKGQIKKQTQNKQQTQNKHQTQNKLQTQVKNQAHVKNQTQAKNQTHSRIPVQNGNQLQIKDKKERANEKAKQQIKSSRAESTPQKEERNSYPLTKPKTKTRSEKALHPYPSLTEIEHMMNKTVIENRSTNGEKNLNGPKQKSIKQQTIGWSLEQPKIHEMLNYDANANQRQFRSQAVQAGPQTIGWQVPPKLALDTVDSFSKDNLDSSISPERTPVKDHLDFSATSPRKSPVLSKQFKSFMQSPWTNIAAGVQSKMPKSSLRDTSQSFLNSSKKRILKLVSPMKEKRESRCVPCAVRKTSQRSVGVQTSKEELRSSDTSSTPLSPPGSYFSAMQQSTPLPNFQDSATQGSPALENTTQEVRERQFNFNRTVESPPKKTKETLNRKLNFALSMDDTGNDDVTMLAGTKTYRSFQSDLEQEAALSKIGFVLSNIRAKLEASDDHAVRTFQEIGQREKEFAAGLDCTDGRHRGDRQRNNQRNRHFAVVERDNEPIYSEIEEDSIHISSSPLFDNKAPPNIKHFRASKDPEAIYAEVVKTPRKSNNEIEVTASQQAQLSQRQQQIQQEQPHRQQQHRNPKEIQQEHQKRQQQQHQKQQHQHHPPPQKPQKPSRIQQPQQQQQLRTTLAKCLQDAIKSKKALKPVAPLKPATNAIPSFYSASYEPPSSSRSSLPASHSLNNVRVQQHHSPPKYNRNLSKSDLSLHRSEIFLENLYSSELVSDRLCLEKVSNSNLDDSYMSIVDSRSEARNQTSHNDSNVDDVDGATRAGTDDYGYDYDYGDDDDYVSYELPDDARSDPSENVASDLNRNAPLPTVHQSTPKKKAQRFTTKPIENSEGSSQEQPRQEPQQQLQELAIDITNPDTHMRADFPNNHPSNSCPNTPHCLPLPNPSDNDSTGCTTSLIEVSTAYTTDDKTQSVCCNNTAARYQRLKNALCKSLRFSKKFVKMDTKRLSGSFSLPAAATTVVTAIKTGNKPSQSGRASVQFSIDSTFNLDILFALDDEDQPLQQQLAKAVSICRQLPDLEISPEMVEAERLLLYSTLRREAEKYRLTTPSSYARSYEPQKLQRFYVDAMRIPIRSNPSQDLFFNYFYICTFYCGGKIKSTQSAECRNQEAIFTDCGIEFACEKEAEVKCEVFMLRLRKVSTISLERNRKTVLSISSSSVASSCDDIVSRFRLHGSFMITPSNFLPYEYVELASKSSNYICLRSSTSCRIAITPRTQSTNLATDVLLTGRADMRFPKCVHSGFLNVQQPENAHNWNRRWCTLDGLFVRVWQDVPQDEEVVGSESVAQPLLQLDLRLRTAPEALDCAPRELCARARSFILDCRAEATEDTGFQSGDPPSEDEVKPEARGVFFAAESQSDLTTWLEKLNEVLDFIAKWMK